MSLLLGNQGLGHAGRPSTSANVKLQPRLRAIRARVQQTGRRVEHRVVFAQAAHDTAVTQPSTSSAAKGLPKSSVWEIDFCSRPLLDERGKKVWELLICDPERNFEYSEYFPNSKINSAEVSTPGVQAGVVCRTSAHAQFLARAAQAHHRADSCPGRC